MKLTEFQIAALRDLSRGLCDLKAASYALIMSLGNDEAKRKDAIKIGDDLSAEFDRRKIDLPSTVDKQEFLDAFNGLYKCVGLAGADQFAAGGEGSAKAFDEFKSARTLIDALAAKWGKLIEDSAQDRSGSPTSPSTPSSATSVLELPGLPKSASSAESQNPGLGYVDALIMKGGGVKGLALAGAVEILERHYSFNAYVGTSAGAIAATLLAIGYTGKELEEELRGQDFRAFLDSRWWWYPWNLLVRGGLHTGEFIQNWLRELIQKRTDRASELLMREIPALPHKKRAVVYAATYNGVLLPLDSRTSDAEVHYAVRCSMGIPFFFQPAKVNGRYAFDGGMLGNFPVRAFIEGERDFATQTGQQHAFQEPRFIGLYLGSKRIQPLRNRLLPSILDMWLGQDERRLLDKYRDQIIVIDPEPVSTVQFSLSDDEKNLLVLRGRIAAMDYVRRRCMPGAPNDEVYGEAKNQLTAVERKVEGGRTRQARCRRLAGAVIFVIVVMIGLGAFIYGPPAEPKTVADHIAQAKSRATLKASLVRDIGTLAEHVNQTWLGNKNTVAVPDLQIDGRRFDFLVYCYDVPYNQLGATVWLLDLYEFSSPVDWELLERDWGGVRGVGSRRILDGLKARPGFLHPVEFTDFFGKPVSARVKYIQLAARRDAVSQKDIDQLIAAQAVADAGGGPPMYRMVFTYDTFGGAAGQ